MLIQADFIEHYMNVTLKMQNLQEAKTFQYFSHRNVVSETRRWPTRSNHLNQPRNFVITQCSCFPSLQPSESSIWETKSKGSGFINKLRSIEFESTLWKIISSTWQLPSWKGKSSSKPPFFVLCILFSMDTWRKLNPNKATCLAWSNSLHHVPCRWVWVARAWLGNLLGQHLCAIWW